MVKYIKGTVSHWLLYVLFVLITLTISMLSRILSGLLYFAQHQTATVFT